MIMTFMTLSSCEALFNAALDQALGLNDEFSVSQNYKPEEKPKKTKKQKTVENLEAAYPSHY